MTLSPKTICLCLAVSAVLTACGGSNGTGSIGGGSSAGGNSSAGSLGGGAPKEENNPALGKGGIDDFEANQGTIFDLLTNKPRNEVGSVNTYLWHASLDVLNFLPIEAADPFTGIIVFGNGRAPGSSQVYRATVYISDPALDARALRVAVSSSRGTASAETQRQIENAILSRARQLRISRAKL
jgi:hypothetical protein